VRRSGAAERPRTPFALVLAACLLVLVALPSSTSVRLLGVTQDCSVAVVGGGPGFCVLPQGQPLQLTVGNHDTCCTTYWTAYSLTDLGSDTIMDGSGNKFTADHFQFAQLNFTATSAHPVTITQTGTHYAASIVDSGGASGSDTVRLGGTDSAGHVMYTDMWGTVNDLSTPIWFLCIFDASWASTFANQFNISGCSMQVTVYAVKVTDSDPTSGQTATPLKIPNGKLTVTSQ
jgi:hypothetical protein